MSRAAMEFARCFFQQLDVVPIPDRGGKVVLHDGLFFAAPEAAHQQDASADAAAPQANAFVSGTHAEP